MELLERRTLFAAGDLDPTFGLGGRAFADVPGVNYERVTAVDVANGRVVIGGVAGANDPNGQPARVALAVLDSAGNPVKSFGGDGFETELLATPGGVIDLVVQPADNKVVVLAGPDPYYTGVVGPVTLARFNADGTLDTTFGGGDGQVQLPFGRTLALGADGRIVVAGGLSNQRVGVARFTPGGGTNGQFVSTVGNPARAHQPGVFGVAVQADGKVVVAAQVAEPISDFSDGVVVRFRADLAGLDTSYGGGDGVVVFDSAQPYDNYDSVDALTLDSQNRVVAAVRLAGGSLGVRRLTPDGSNDPTFADSRYTRDAGGAEDISVAADGRIVVSGTTWYSGDMLIRFNANGGLDTSFGGGDGSRQGQYAGGEPVAGPFSDVLPDGRIVTAGSYGPFAAYRHVASNSANVGTVTLGTDRVIRITGTEGRDEVILNEDGFAYPDQTYDVYVNGHWYAFPRTQVARLEISTLGGADLVREWFAESTTGSIPRRMNGGAGNDELHGGNGNDELFGSDGNDRLFGRGGNDLVDGGLGADLMDGGTGADTVDYSFRNSAVHVDLDGDADDGTSGERDTVAANVEHINGGNGADTLVGNGNPNFIRGNGGNDTIRGGAGNDTLVGGLGQDRLYGDAGDDFLDARDGVTDLVLDGGAGFDRAKKDGGDPRTSIEQLV